MVVGRGEHPPWTVSAVRLRDLSLGGAGTVVFAGLLASVFGIAGVGAAVGVGVVWLLLGGPYGYAVGQLLVATLLPIPLDSALFLPVQGALLAVCFGRLLVSVRPVETALTAVGSLVVVSALLVVSLGSAVSLWQTSVLFVTTAAVATALFHWYQPPTATVEMSR